MDILHLIDRLDALIEAGFSVPGTGKVLIDREAALDLIDEMRTSVPDDLQHAQEVLQTREALLAEAKDASERMRREGEEAYRQRLDQHDLVAGARKEAQAILARSQQDAEAQLAKAQQDLVTRRRELDEYSLTLLRRLEGNLNAQLGQIRQGIEGLMEKQRLGGAGTAPEDQGR